MRSVLNVILNRVKKHGKSIEQIILAPEQFTSMSVESDPEYDLDPAKTTGVDAQMWQEALTLARGASLGDLEDDTHGATLYYAPTGIRTHATYTLPTGLTIPFPQTWNPKAVRYTATIESQVFFTET